MSMTTNNKNKTKVLLKVSGKPIPVPPRFKYRDYLYLTLVPFSVVEAMPRWLLTKADKQLILATIGGTDEHGNGFLTKLCAKMSISATVTESVFRITIVLHGHDLTVSETKNKLVVDREISGFDIESPTAGADANALIEKALEELFLSY